MMATFEKMRWMLLSVLVTVYCSLEGALLIPLMVLDRPAGHALQPGSAACIGRPSSAPEMLLSSVEVR